MVRSVHLLLARRERLPRASARSSWLHYRQVAVAFLADENVEIDVVDRFKSMVTSSRTLPNCLPVAQIPRCRKSRPGPGKFSLPTTRTLENLSSKAPSLRRRYDSSVARLASGCQSSDGSTCRPALRRRALGRGYGGAADNPVEESAGLKLEEPTGRSLQSAAAATLLTTLSPVRVRPGERKQKVPLSGGTFCFLPQAGLETKERGAISAESATGRRAPASEAAWRQPPRRRRAEGESSRGGGLGSQLRKRLPVFSPGHGTDAARMALYFAAARISMKRTSPDPRFVEYRLGRLTDFHSGANASPPLERNTDTSESAKPGAFRVSTSTSSV